MYLLLSGEGKSDIGACSLALDACDAVNFQPGPMSWMVDQLIERSLGYDCSYIGMACVSYVSESYLATNKSLSIKPKKPTGLPGKKKPIETKYYYENARALAVAAKSKMIQINDVVIAVLFRDADGTASAGRGEWAHKIQSIQAGFAIEDFEYGIAMMPKPKSEAWLLCALKENPYQHCQQLENLSGNDNSQKPLKNQLSEALEGQDATAQLNDLVLNGQVNIDRIDMNSFNVFKANLENVVKKAQNWKSKDLKGISINGY